jgi:hypothetical protein
MSETNKTVPSAVPADPFVVLRLSDTHEWRLRGRKWELHFLPNDDGTALRTASRFEAELLDAAKREIDAARVAKE